MTHNKVREQAPDWFCERFYEQNVKPTLEEQKFDTMTMEWITSKPTLIATINYLRTQKKLKVAWMEKREDLFIIKIFKP